MIEQDLKNLIIERYTSLSRFAETIEMPWTTLDGVLKRGVNKANITSLIKICNGLNIDCESLYYGRILPKQDLLNTTPLNADEMDHIKKYRTLDKYGIQAVDSILNIEYDRCVKELDSEYSSEPIKYIDRYINIASAGTGEYLVDDIPSEKIQVSLDCKADFAVGVHGESMEPSYHDGETVLVKKQSELNIGDIGIFIINGDCYIKECGGDRLISHNKNYPDIDLKDGMDFRVVGKVVGKLD